MRGARAAAPIAALAALLAGALPFVVSVTAWPEIVTPAWFVTRGVRLYDGILFPHTPLLILLTAAAGALFGFTPNVLRAIPALSLAAAGGLVVLGTRPHRRARSGPRAALALGVPVLALLTVYAEGPAIWPEPFLAPLLLAGVLLLERHERTGALGDVAAAGLVFGAGILVKQTSAWAALAALLWVALRGRRRAALLFGAAAALPYLGFALSWALAFRTTRHLAWTLIYPVFSGMSREIAVRLTGADAHEALVLFVPFAALGLSAAALPARRLRSPLAAVALGAVGMAWPRPGLLHLAALTGLGALAAARLALVLPVVFRRLRKGRGGPLRLFGAAGGAAACAVFLAVAALGAGPLLLDRAGGPVFYWDDSASRAAAALVRERVPAGGTLLVHGALQNLYPLTGTGAPGRFYVNPSFWYCLRRDRGNERLVDALAASPGLPILFREPIADVERIRETAVYAFVKERTRPAGNAGDAEWRVVPAAGR
ncbi:MAG TPA: glycosyltransferase family 39 protein [Thermoanaerobaculia bacterium]